MALTNAQLKFAHLVLALCSLFLLLQFYRQNNTHNHGSNIYCYHLIASYDADNQPFHSQDLISNSPYYKPYNSYDVSLENLVLDQLNISLSLFPLYSHHLSAWYCIDIVRRTSLLVTYGIWGGYRYKSFSASFLVRTNNSFELWAKSDKHWWQLQSIRIFFFFVHSFFFSSAGENLGMRQNQPNYSKW